MDMDAFLDSSFPGAEAQTEDHSEEVDTETADAQAAETTEDPENPEESEESDQTEETENSEAAATDTDTDTEKPVGQFEKGVLATLAKAKIPDSLQKRIAKAFSNEIKHRTALTQREEALKSKDEELAAIQTQLAEAGQKVAPVPSGPLAHLDSLEALEAAARQATAFLRWKEGPMEDFDKFFKDEEAFKAYQADALYILEHQAAQAKVLSERKQTREKLKAASPTFFQPDHADAKALKEFYATDPRTRADADDVFRLYMKARKQEEEEAKGIRYHRITPTAKAPAVGEEDDAADSPTAKGKSTSFKLPPPKPSAPRRVPVLPATSRKAAMWEKSRTAPVDAEELMEAV